MSSMESYSPMFGMQREHQLVEMESNPDQLDRCTRVMENHGMAKSVDRAFRSEVYESSLFNRNLAAVRTRMRRRSREIPVHLERRTTLRTATRNDEPSKCGTITRFNNVCFSSHASHCNVDIGQGSRRCGTNLGARDGRRCGREYGRSE